VIVESKDSVSFFWSFYLLQLQSVVIKRSREFCLFVEYMEFIPINGVQRRVRTSVSRLASDFTTDRSRKYIVACLLLWQHCSVLFGMADTVTY
jgi:hypothetical protein